MLGEKVSVRVSEQDKWYIVSFDLVTFPEQTNTVPVMKLHFCEWAVPRDCSLALLSHGWRGIISNKGSTLYFFFLPYITHMCF